MTPNDWEPPDWHEPKDLRPRYRTARAGFVLSGLGLSMLALDMSCELLAIFGRNLNLWHLRFTPIWHWVVAAPLTWGTFLGSLLLLGRFDDSGWKRRSVLLFLMNTFDLVVWCLDNAEVLGLHSGPPFKANPMLQVAGPFMNLIELLLFAGLARDVCTHLGRSDAIAPYLATRAAVGIATSLQIIVTLNEVDFAGGWPWKIQQNGDPMIFLAWLASQIGLTAAAYFTVFLMALACQQCSWMVRDLNQQYREDDPFAM